MSAVDLDFDRNRAVERLMRLLAVEGITGQEQAISRATAEELRAAGVAAGEMRAAGVAASAILDDEAQARIPLPTQCGNLIAHLPGTRPGPRLLFMTHLDTVPLAAGAKPVLSADRKRITPEGRTALGGDNRTGVACLVTLAATLLARKLPHPPLTLLFTVREESGLWGARHVDLKRLHDPVMGFNVDGGKARDLTIGAVGAERWEVQIEGKAAHAGVHPEKGISATLVAALALAEVKRGGWFGKIRKKAGEGTSNVGSFGGQDGKAAGDATNVVTDYVHIRGEARSHDSRFTKAIVKAYRDAFTHAAAQVTDDQGKKAKVKFTSRLDYHPFRMKETSPVVQHAWDAAMRAGLEPLIRISNGGLDANWINRHGIPTVTFGAGQNLIHTVEEWVDVPEYLQGCRLALALATAEAP
jgi:tripeptide aminopeptidase